jgi:hypothetical protein
MARLGQCRCGAILRFEKTSRGYKMRCPVCKSIVRLRTDATPHKKRPHSRAAVTAPNLPPPPSGDFILEAGTDLSVLSFHEHTAPAALVEMEAFREPPPRPAAWPWWLFAGVAVLAASTIILLVVLFFG